MEQIQYNDCAVRLKKNLYGTRLYRLNDVVVAIGFARMYAFQIAKKIHIEHKYRIGPRGQQAWYVTLKGLEQWAADEPHYYDSVARGHLRAFVAQEQNNELNG